MDEIRWEPSTTASHIGVTAANGVVTLTGVVATYAEKWAVERAAQRVEGVKGIAEEITIKLTGVHVRSDAEIAEAAVNAIKWHVWVPGDIQPTVAQGWVTLKGNVNWEYQRTAAKDAVCFMPGGEGRLERHHRPAGGPAVRRQRLDREGVRAERRDRRRERDGDRRRRDGDPDRQRPVVGREGRGRNRCLERPGRQHRAERHRGHLPVTPACDRRWSN